MDVQEASAFNQDIGELGHGKSDGYLQQTFYGASAFNQDIGDWNTEKVTSMYQMFLGASAFNGNIGRWNTGNVTTMLRMFYGASAFNQDISGWTGAATTAQAGMFVGATAFQAAMVCNYASTGPANSCQPKVCTPNDKEDLIGLRMPACWKVQTVSVLFLQHATGSPGCNNVGANGAIGDWNTEKVTSMYQMFYRASAFNQDIGSWDTGKVTTMYKMFQGASAFNHRHQRLEHGKSDGYVEYVRSGIDVQPRHR